MSDEVLSPLAASVVTAIVVAVVMVLGFSSVSRERSSAAFDRGYDAGVEDSERGELREYNEAWEDGYEQGQALGWSEGLGDGRNEVEAEVRDRKNDIWSFMAYYFDDQFGGPGAFEDVGCYEVFANDWCNR